MAQDNKSDSRSGRSSDSAANSRDDGEPGDVVADYSDASRAYWGKQDRALSQFRQRHGAWTNKRRSGQAGKSPQSWKRETFSLPRAEAQAKARAFLKKYPKAAYWSEVESWRELPGDIIEFTMRRLPTAD